MTFWTYNEFQKSSFIHKITSIKTLQGILKTYSLLTQTMSLPYLLTSWKSFPFIALRLIAALYKTVPICDCSLSAPLLLGTSWFSFSCLGSLWLCSHLTSYRTAELKTRFLNWKPKPFWDLPVTLNKPGSHRWIKPILLHILAALLWFCTKALQIQP